MNVEKLASFTRAPLSVVPPEYRGFWDIGGNDIFKCDNKNYGPRDILGIANILKLNYLSEVAGDFDLIKFVK